MKQLSNNAVSDFMVSYGTHAGMVGKNNEDYVAFAAFDTGGGEGDSPEILHLGIVADGVGGQTAGERASQVATNSIIAYFESIESMTIDDVGDHFEKAVTQANQAVIDEANEHTELKGMATTVAIVAILEGLLFTTHIGDSRIYLFRNDTLYQLTNDHSWVQEALQAGIISVEEARNHPNRNIIRRSLGTMKSVEVDQAMISAEGIHFWQGMPLRKDDAVLVCSDGLSDMINDYDIKLSIEREDTEVSEMVVELIDKANEAGGRDNITVILFKPATSFKPNRMMPIPPPTLETIRRRYTGPEPEKLTLVGGSIKSNSVAPVTIRSMPKVTQDMVPANRMKSAEDMMSTIKMKSQPRSKNGPTRLNGETQKSEQAKPMSVDALSDDRSNGHHPNETHISTGAPIYRWMMRLVLGLLLVAILLAVIWMALGRF